MGLTEILTILGIVAAAFVAYFIAKKRGYYEDLVFELVIACVPLGILGGRLGYFLEDITSPVGQKMRSVAAFFGVTGRAGLSLYGEILGAAAGAFILSLVNGRLMAKNPEKYHYRKVNFVQMFDVVLCVLPLGLSCMSLGNAAESSGFFTSVHFYAFLWYAASEALLLWLYAGKRKSFDAFITAVSLVLTGGGDIIFCGFDEGALWLAENIIKTRQLLGLVAVLAGIAIILAYIVKAAKSGKEFFILVKIDALGDGYYGYDVSQVGKEPLIAPDDKKKEVQFDEVSDGDQYWLKTQDGDADDSLDADSSDKEKSDNDNENR